MSSTPKHLNALNSVLLASEDDDLGHYTELAEARFAEYLGVNTFVLAGSGLTSLQAALWAVGARPGREVICDALFPFAIMAIRNVGAIPVIADIMPDSLTIDPRSVAKVVSPATVAVVATAAFGIPPLSRELAANLNNGIALIEDHAQAFGTVMNGKTIASSAQICCFSFQHGKLISCGQGGGVASSDTRFSVLVRRYLELGWYPRDLPSGEKDWRSSWESRAVGCLSARMPPIAAALLLGRLDKFQMSLHELKELIKEIQCLIISKLPEVSIQLEPTNYEGPKWRIVLLTANEHATTVLRETLCALGSKSYRCNSPPASTWPRLRQKHFLDVPVTEAIMKKTLMLPVATIQEARRELKALKKLP